MLRAEGTAPRHPRLGPARGPWPRPPHSTPPLRCTRSDPTGERCLNTPGGFHPCASPPTADSTGHVTPPPCLPPGHVSPTPLSTLPGRLPNPARPQTQAATTLPHHIRVNLNVCNTTGPLSVCPPEDWLPRPCRHAGSWWAPRVFVQ